MGVESRVRSVRMPDVLWASLAKVASARGVSVSTVIVWALSEFVEEGDRWERR